MAYTKDTYRGKYIAKNPQKYAGDSTQIVYRSSYELRFMKWCDFNDSVLQWGSEEIVFLSRKVAVNISEELMPGEMVRSKE